MRPPMSPQVLVNRPAIRPVDLEGKRILLTGASSGIGEAAAEQFAREGAKVVVAARRRERLDALAERITAAGGIAESIPCDVSDMDAVDALVATPMIAPTRAFDGMPALTSEEAAQWMVTAARTRPVRIAPRMAIAAQALDTVSPRWVNALMQRHSAQSNHEADG